MKIAYLGVGTWGFALAYRLVKNGHEVVAWTRDEPLVQELRKKGMHPKLQGKPLDAPMKITSCLEEALVDVDIIVESVTSSGIREVLTRVLSIATKPLPVILTSKGIEEKTSFLLPEVVEEILGEKNRFLIGCLSGPSHAEEVVKDLPTSVVASSYDPKLTQTIIQMFSAESFRIYPTTDVNGTAFGGAMKNVIAIACGVSDGLGFGDNTKAALMTRGLHEMRKLSKTKGCKEETLNGLSGMGDLCVSCLSKHSRNYQLGYLLAQGHSLLSAKEKIGMVVEGAYAAKSILQLAKKHNMPVPITEAIYHVIYSGKDPKQSVKDLLARTVKEESL